MNCFTKNCLNDAAPKRRYCNKCRSRKYRVENPIMAAYHNKKGDARSRGIEFKWTFREFRKFCKETRYIELKGTGPDDYSIDRKRAWEGYHKDNVQLLKNSDHGRKTRKEPRVDPSGNGRQPDDPF